MKLSWCIPRQYFIYGLGLPASSDRYGHARSRRRASARRGEKPRCILYDNSTNTVAVRSFFRNFSSLQAACNSPAASTYLPRGMPLWCVIDVEAHAAHYCRVTKSKKNRTVHISNRSPVSTAWSRYFGGQMDSWTVYDPSAGWKPYKKVHYLLVVLVDVSWVGSVVRHTRSFFFRSFFLNFLCSFFVFRFPLSTYLYCWRTVMAR